MHQASLGRTHKKLVTGQPLAGEQETLPVNPFVFFEFWHLEVTYSKNVILIFLSKKIPQNVILGPNSVPWLSASIFQHYPMPQIHLFTDSLWWLFHILFPMPKPPAWHPSSFLAEAFKYCFIEKADSPLPGTQHNLCLSPPSLPAFLL